MAEIVNPTDYFFEADINLYRALPEEPVGYEVCSEVEQLATTSCPARVSGRRSKLTEFEVHFDL